MEQIWDGQLHAVTHRNSTYITRTVAGSRASNLDTQSIFSISTPSWLLCDHSNRCKGNVELESPLFASFDVGLRNFDAPDLKSSNG